MPAEDIRQKLLPRFRETTADRVEKISTALLTIERGSGDADGRQELARELHTLKGESRMMGFIGISTVIHAAEDLLKSLPDAATGEPLEALLKACDAIAKLSKRVERIGTVVEVIDEIADRSDLLALNAALEGAKALSLIHI